MIKNILVFITLFVISLGASALTLKISTAYPDGTAILNAYKAAAKEIDQKTEGRVKFKFYPGGVMGDDRSVLRKVRIGQLHGAIVQTGLFADVFKDGQIYNAPMLFQSYEEVDYVREKYDETIVEGYKNGGWKTFGLLEGGFAYLVSVNPVKSREDLIQQKFWIPSNDLISEKISNAFGISPIILGYGEVKTSLETGAINALASPPIATISMQWFTKVKYLTDLPFLYTTATLAVDNKAFGKISDADQKIVEASLRQASSKLDALNRTDNVKAYDALLNQGIEVVNLSEEERNALLVESIAANKKLIEMGEFSQEVYDQVVVWLTEFRNQ